MAMTNEEIDAEIARLQSLKEQNNNLENASNVVENLKEGKDGQD